MSARYIWTRRLALAAGAALVLALLIAGVAGLVALATRGGDRDPFLDSRPPPGLAQRFYPPAGWAWGLIQLGESPPQRYGVSGPAMTPSAQVLILPDYGETAEAWFETAADLNRAGAVVWVLEGAGQGGSARLIGRRDLGELKSFDADVAAVHAMIGAVIRPQGRTPVVLVGQGAGAWVAARAAETGAPVSALVLSQPRCDPPPPAAWLRRVGFGSVRAAGGRGWTRAGPDAFAAGLTHDRWRGAVTHAWQLVNPDLRMGGPSLDWQVAFAQLQAETRANATKIRAPGLLIVGPPAPCLSVPGGQPRQIVGAGPELELESDPQRNQWLDLISGTFDGPQAGHAP